MSELGVGGVIEQLELGFHWVEELLVVIGLVIAALTPLLDVGLVTLAIGLAIMWTKGKLS